MALATKQANHFVLSCDDTEVTYDTTSITGQPLLSYAGPEGRLSFSGSEIETLDSALGTEVTVTLERVPDLHTITFTLLLASFRLAQDDEAAFDTVAIKTTNHTTIAGPPEGPAQSYEAVALHGTAAAVVF